MKLKKLVSVLLVAACVFSLAACGSFIHAGESYPGEVFQLAAVEGASAPLFSDG